MSVSDSWFLSASAGARYSLLLAAACSLAFAGCDITGEYEKKFQNALQTSAQRAVFDQNLFAAETEVTDAGGKGVGVKFRLPSLFDNDSKALVAKESRAHVPFVTLPDLSYARERQLNDAGEQFLPVYAYFAAVPKADQKADAVQAAIAQQVAGTFAGAAWADAPLATPDGKTITLKRLRVNGPQEFMNLTKNTPVKTDGRFDLYFIDGPAHFVLIGWRAPKAQSEKWQFDAKTESAMGTVTVTEAAAAAAPAGEAPAAGANKTGCF
jgi:hypothetical protein